MDHKNQYSIKGPLYIAIYRVSRHYGGPEEGGWWYDSGHVVDSLKLRRSERAKSGWIKDSALRRLLHDAEQRHGHIFNSGKRRPKGYRDRGSVIGGPDLEYRIERGVPCDWPVERPRYE